MATKPASRTTTATSRQTTTSTSIASSSARPLPYSEDAERALLGSMLRETEAIAEAITGLQIGGSDAVFFHERHQVLFEFIVELYDKNRLIDGVIIKDELVRRGLFEKLGGFEFLNELISSVPSALRAREYARIVLEKHLLRKLISATHRVMETAYEDALPAQETLDYAEQEICEVTEKRVVGGAVQVNDLLQKAFEVIEQQGDVLTGEPTGYFKLDEITRGFQPSELVIIAARPSMGKTALGLNIAEHMAIVEDRPVLFFSLEMSKEQLVQRVLCSQARIDSHKLRSGMLAPQELEALKNAADKLRNKPLFVDDVAHLSILELRARARMIFRRHNIRAIFVDYLQLMHCPNSESRQVEVASISRGLKALAKELKVPVIALAQLNRSPEERGRQGMNRPRMSNLRESGAIEQDADVIALLHREDYYRTPGTDDEQIQPDNKAELIIAKQRNGPTGTIMLHFNRQSTRFDNYAVGDDPGAYRPAASTSFSSDLNVASGDPAAPF